jgi:gamma-glutamyltranspeptidase/glutathione hydrolase
LFEKFGSGLVAGDTGIALHNRGALFNLDPGHPNVVAPHKRPFHTLIPGMVLKDNEPFFSFGVMGADNQPQGHVQVLLNMFDFGMDPQQAGEAPRFRHAGEGVLLESAFDSTIRAGLAGLGHQIASVESAAFVASGVDGWGGYQGILIDPVTGVLIGGSDPRKDGLAIGW